MGRKAQERGYQPDLSEGRPRCPGPQKAADGTSCPPDAPPARIWAACAEGRVRSGGPAPRPRQVLPSGTHAPLSVCKLPSGRRRVRGEPESVCSPRPHALRGTPSVAVGVASLCAVTPCCVPRAGPAPGHGPVQSVASASRFPSVSPSVSRISPETCPHLVTVKPAGPSAVTARSSLRAAAVAAGQGAGKQRPWRMEGGLNPWPWARQPHRTPQEAGSAPARKTVLEP